MIRGLKAAEGRPRLQWLACRVQPLHLPHPKWERKRSDFEIKKNINFPYISIKHCSQHFWITPLLLQHQAVTSCHILTIPDPCRGTWGSKSCLSWSWASAPLRDFWRAPTWTFRCQDLPGRLIAMGWWYTYPSEKYEPMGRTTSHILWNHQPAISSNN